MFPTFAVNNHRNSAYVHTHHLANGCAAYALHRQQTNLLYLLFCYFCSGVANSSAASAFCHHVAAVLGRCTQEQMTWIHALRIIAFVADKLAVGNGANMKSVGRAMGKVGAAHVASFTVAILVRGAWPKPAGSGISRYSIFLKCLFWTVGATVVTRKESKRLTFDCTTNVIRPLGYRRFLSASTKTQTIRIEWLANGVYAASVARKKTSLLAWILGRIECQTTAAFTLFSVLRGIIGVHKKFTFLVSKPRAFRDAAGHFLLGCYRSNYSTNGLGMQPCPPESTD